MTKPNKPYDTLVTKFSFCHNSSFNKNGGLVSSRARFFVLFSVQSFDQFVCISMLANLFVHGFWYFKIFVKSI